MDLNQQLFQFLFSFAHRNSILDALIAFSAEYLTYLLAIALILWLFSKKGRERIFIALELLISFILARGLITEWIRFFYNHPRPFDVLGIKSLVSESGASFPSGNMTALFSLGLVLWFYNRKFGYWFLGFSFVVGIARITAGVHWPLDILGGIVAGVLSALLVHKLLKSYWARLHKPKEEITGMEKTEAIEMQNPQ